ncbi:MAG: tetratricopeptide repeat protein [Promethearchaeota archaeon]|jgi:tetratricopeptide (TPR) repeat protein
MKKIYVFPLIGAIVTLFGLCFPVVFIYDGVTIWLWGFYMVELKSPVYVRINYEKEFETFLRSTLILGFSFFLFILISLIFIIQISIQMRKRQIYMIDAKRQWDRRLFALIASLVSYVIYITMIMKPQDVHYKHGIFIQFLGGFICLMPSISRLNKLVYKINKYLTLKLKNDETVIYIADEPFEICKHLIISIPVEHVNDIESIDEVVDGYGQDIEYKFYSHEVKLTPKEIFKGHCSNLQVWVESGYDTCLLGSNLAFPLLKRLTEVGDLKASSVFKDEIRKRFGSLYAPVQQYLICEGYLKYFSKSEKQELLEYVINFDSWVLIGKNYSSNSQEEEAIEAYEHAFEIDPVNETILKRLCSLNIIIEDYQKALKYYNLLSELYGLKNHDYLALGDIYIKLGQYDNAKRMYRHILQRKELNFRSQALLNLGDFYLSQLEIDRAKKLYWDAIELNHNDIRAWIKLSELFQRGGKICPAIETLKEGLRYRPHNTFLLFQLRLLYKTNRNFWEYFKFSIIYLIYKNMNIIKNTIKKDELISNLPRGMFACEKEKKNIVDFEAIKEKIFSY